MAYQLIDKEKFDSLSPAEQRIAIAKDVIARVRTKLVVPYNGDLFSNVHTYEWDESMQSQFNKESCYVCARGALVCSWVGNFNRYNYTDIANLHHRNPLPPEIQDLFGKEQIDLIESAFEATIYEWHENGGEDDDIMLDSKYFGEIEGIMQNIVDNGGTFVFEQVLSDDE